MKTKNKEERTITVTVKFTTDSIVKGKGNIRPGHAWDVGFVYLNASKNTLHNLTWGNKNPKPFNSMSELPVILEKVLISHGVILHRGDRSRKLYAAD